MPTDEDKRKRVQIGREIFESVAHLTKKYPGLEIVCSYTTPHPTLPSKFKVSLVSTIDDPQLLLTVLVGSARDVKEQMIDPFTLQIRRPGDN